MSDVDPELAICIYCALKRHDECLWESRWCGCAADGCLRWLIGDGFEETNGQS